MAEFYIFLEQGFFHILDLSGYDHILFLFAICAIYSVKDLKKLVWIISSFTLAHSITLALSALNFLVLDVALIEFLIAFTIFFTCIENLFLSKLHRYRVLFSFAFGLIHGLGFSRMLKDLFMGMEFNLLSTLLPFNLGLEGGQLIILSIILILIFLAGRAGIRPKVINFIISIPIGLQAVFWMWQRWPFN